MAASINFYALYKTIVGWQINFYNLSWSINF